MLPTAPSVQHRKLAQLAPGSCTTCARSPVSVSIPAAALVCAGSGARRHEYGWAAYRAGSALGKAGTCVLSGVAFAGAPQLVRREGLFLSAHLNRDRIWMAERPQAHGGMHRRRAGDRFCSGDTASQTSGLPRRRSRVARRRDDRFHPTIRFRRAIASATTESSALPRRGALPGSPTGSCVRRPGWGFFRRAGRCAMRQSCSRRRR